MDRLILLLRDTSDSNIGSADSFSDRLNNKYTVSILVIFALLTTTRQYVSEPISCWCPNQFTKDQVDYVNKVCWTTSTYYLEDSVTEIPGEKEPIDKVSYYQWIPLVAVGQAFMFVMPKILWTIFSRKTGIPVDTITDAAMERQKKSEQAAADKTMDFMVKTLGKFLKELSWDQRYAKRMKCYSLRHKIFVTFYGNYLTCLYVLVKLLYILNVILQIVLLNFFLQTNYSMYGFETMSRMVKGEDWTTSHRFPRIAMCNFIIRAMGENMHRYSVQCAIPINLIHEIFYIFLWFWFVFILTLTSASCVFWCYSCYPQTPRLLYVREKLYADGQLRRRPDEETERHFNNFVLKYLKRDGCFIARLVAKNTSDVVSADLLAGLWKDYVLKTIRYEAEKRLLLDNDTSPEVNSAPNKIGPFQRVMSEPERL